VEAGERDGGAERGRRGEGEKREREVEKEGEKEGELVSVTAQSKHTSHK